MVGQPVEQGAGQAFGGEHAGPYGPLVRQPDVAGGVTQSPYIIVADADAHHERARAAGTKILLELVDQDYGGRGYTCADPEGHVWNFGTYDPWAELKA